MTENFTVRQGIERLQQSRLNYMIQSKNNYPMLNASGEYNYSKASDNQDYAYDINAYKAGFDVFVGIRYLGEKADIFPSNTITL